MSKRISIIGHSGSGKTTLARHISETLNVPYLDIDRLWFEAQGHKISLSDSAGAMPSSLSGMI
jgi:adenylate kinase family enzyme